MSELSKQPDPPYLPREGKNNRGYIIGWSIGVALFLVLFIWYVVAK
jgi:hypothetical protein